jgi:RimJ/RimL family protein N-acetyltransferase
MPFAPEWPLETERLVLRPFAQDDFDAVYAMRSDPKVFRYLYSEPHRSPEETRAFLQQRIESAVLEEEGQWLSAAAALRDTGEVVVEVVLKWESAEHRQGELGYIVHPAHNGQGYAAEASLPILRFGFETLVLHRVVGRLDARNAASARVLEKLGMRQEAHLVENEWVKGEWTSELVYAVLAAEFAAGPAQT